jgi:two-component system, OmpR family, response regulator MprA
MYPSGQNILVAIGDRALRELVAHTLAREGFSITAAAEGLAALRAVRGQRYVLLIAAEQLPGSVDGSATIRHALLRQPWLKTLLVARSAAGGETRHDPDVLAAPFEARELLGCTFELLHRCGGAADLACRVRTSLTAS